MSSIYSPNFKTFDNQKDQGHRERHKFATQTHMNDLLDMARNNLDGLNSSMNRSRERDYENIPKSKLNMYKFLEYNRPPSTPSAKFRMRDNYMGSKIGSPISRAGDSINIDNINNQSYLSVEGSPAQEATYEGLPPKTPLGLASPQINNADLNHHSISIKLANQAQILQDKIELEFKGQMAASKEEMLFLQKEMTDNIKQDLKKASECADDLETLQKKFDEYKTETTGRLDLVLREIELVKAENNTLRDEVIKSSHKVDQVEKIKHQVDDSLGSLEETLKRDLRPMIDEITTQLNQLENQFKNDSRQKDTSIRTLVTSLDEHVDTFNKYKKDTQKKLTRYINSEGLDDLRVELSKDYIHKINKNAKELEVNLEDQRVQVQDIQKRLGKRIDTLEETSNQVLDQIDTLKGRDLSRSSAPKETPGMRQLEGKVKRLQDDVEDISFKVNQLDKKIDGANSLNLIRNDSQMIQETKLKSTGLRIPENSSEDEEEKVQNLTQKYQTKLEKVDSFNDLEEVQLEEDKPSLMKKDKSSNSIWGTNNRPSHSSRPSASQRSSRVSSKKSSRPSKKTEERVEPFKKSEPSLKSESKEESKKVETVQKFEMFDEEKKKKQLAEKIAPSQRPEPTQKAVSHQKTGPAQNTGFLDNLDSSFNEEDSEDESGLESSKGGVQFFGNQNKLSTNTASKAPAQQSQKEIERITNQLIEDEISKSMAKHKNITQAHELINPVRNRNVPSWRSQIEPVSQVDTKPKAFEYRGIRRQTESIQNPKNDFGDWDVTNNDQRQSDPSDFQAKQEVDSESIEDDWDYEPEEKKTKAQPAAQRNQDMYNKPQPAFNRPQPAASKPQKEAKPRNSGFDYGGLDDFDEESMDHSVESASDDYDWGSMEF
ncbi:unnamed protein product [Moneuplotes crassus]|uniref:Uncharacterized protein n=1 Tax=Euplotes crassus TaxID=5936 RepID=A0AAD1Y3B7_EUPCR|nr:unnamed protein product [Moneuplotes crassus]